jgi:hypothetical protein
VKDEPEADRHVIPRRIVSMPDDLWNDLGQHVGERERSATIRELVRWWLRKPGAKMPKRPPAAE